MSTPAKLKKGVDKVEPGVVISDAAREWQAIADGDHIRIGGLDKDTRLANERKQAAATQALQSLDPPFPYRCVPFEPAFFQL